MHLVRVEYTDSEGAPEDTLIWEREHNRRLLEPTAMPRVGDEPPMLAADFDALLRATRWGALTPFLSPDGTEASKEPSIISPAFGAVQVEDFQLVPVLKALQMPRVSLLLADDVGLGKTVEAGLLVAELLQRRRIRRVLVLCPASLRKQWQQEMQDKFSLGFDLVDREETHALRTRLGLDANPWRTFPRIIASYYYLRQPDVLEQFMATCRAPDGSVHLPWDLLVVDEAHNLMPAPFGEDSDLAQMLRHISPFFEHKLFLTATPHNGHTRCFTGLLEQLDPVRFTQKSEVSDAERRRVEEVVVRRLKGEINALDDQQGRPRRFAARELQPLALHLGPGERGLAESFAALRDGVRAVTARTDQAQAMAGKFAIEVLNKRLLSCPSTFAESWFRFRQGLAESVAADAAEVTAAQRASQEELDDDREREGRALHAAQTVGAWLQALAPSLQAEIAGVDAALRQLGLEPQEEGLSPPREDVRLECLRTLIEQRLRRNQEWSPDERLIVFTEYKTTLDYLERRLLELYPGAGTAIRILYGGLDLSKRDAIKRAFNDPEDPVRILLATDAAAEGLNLQETARLLLHYDIPWNPSRLEQRNGRLDRHGQARDVLVHHFTSEDDADLRFLGRVVRKVESIREDLGSMGEVFDAAFQSRFQDLVDAETVNRLLDTALARRKGQAQTPRAPMDAVAMRSTQRLGELFRHLDLSPETLRQTLEIALRVGGGEPRLEGPDERGRMRLKLARPGRWGPLIDDSLRLPGRAGEHGALPKLVFDPKDFLATLNGRPVFRPTPDTVLLHLGHPLFHEVLATFARLRFPGERDVASPSRWTVRRGAVPSGAEALLVVSIEELAVNELREPFHHWVRTLRLPVKNKAMGPPEPYLSPAEERAVELTAAEREEAVHRATHLWEEVAGDLQDFLRAATGERTKQVRELLTAAGRQARGEEKKRYADRLKEVEAALRETSIAKLERERDQLLEQLRQEEFFPEQNRQRAAKLREVEEELHRRTTHYRELLVLLEKDQTRVLERMLPRRYTLHGEVRLFPITVELRLPEVRR
jgi:ERCC4-related helicase